MKISKFKLKKSKKNRLNLSMGRFWLLMVTQYLLSVVSSNLWVRRPGDFDRSPIAMFFLHKNLSVGWDMTTCLIVFDGDKGKVRPQSLKMDLSPFTSPYFYDVLVHICVLI